MTHALTPKIGQTFRSTSARYLKSKPRLATRTLHAVEPRNFAHPLGAQWAAGYTVPNDPEIRWVLAAAFSAWLKNAQRVPA